MSKRIGIYSGTFDPVHTGHVAFALQAVQAAQLQAVYFMPERRPRRKPSVVHYGHRITMLNKAVRPHAKLKVLETVDATFSVRRTLPYLRQQFGDADLVFLLGSDAVQHLHKWEHVNRLVETAEFCVGLREQDDEKSLTSIFSALGVPPSRLFFVKSFAPLVSSTKVRDAIRSKHYIFGVLASVRRYAEKEWLYQ